MIDHLVSIITPLYNGERFVGETIESVLAQTYPHWEMLIIDDGSTDNSPQIAEQYAAKDTRIKVLHQANAGSATARNNGIRRAQGRYIALLDADDLWEPIFLEEQLKLLQNTLGALLVCAAHKRIDEQGNECLSPFVAPPEAHYTDLLKTCSITCLTGLYDTKAFGKMYLREELVSLRDDYVYWLDIIHKVNVVYANPKILGSYRIIRNSVSRNKHKVIIPQFKVYYKCERLGFWRSLYYTICWAWNGYKKYRK